MFTGIIEQIGVVSKIQKEGQNIHFTILADFFNELKYEELSEILGTSVGALKASYHHAVKKIEAHLSQTN